MTETAKQMKASNWNVGYLQDFNESSWEPSTHSQFVGTQNTSRYPGKPIGNYSDFQNFTGNYKTNYETETKDRLGKESSALSCGFVKPQPAFDRVSACKTNIDFGNSAPSNPYETSYGSALTHPCKSMYGECRHQSAMRLQGSRKDLGYNFRGVAFGDSRVAPKQVGDKKCFDRPPPRDPTNKVYNLVTGKYQKQQFAPSIINT